MLPTAKCEIRDSAGKGQGLFATRDIKLGENILRETPIYKFDEHEVARVAQHCDFKMLQNFAAYDANLEPVARLIKVSKRSGLPLGGGTGGLFTMASKMNHSCCPNANHHSSNGPLYVQALADISEGEEITITYMDCEHWDGRQGRLDLLFAFTCTCPACTVDDPRRDVSIRVANSLKHEIARTLMCNRKTTQYYLRKYVELLCSRLELRAELPGALYDAFQFACANQDRGAAEHYMTLKLKYSLLFQGEDNPSVLNWRKLKENPANYIFWGKASYPPSPVERLDVDAMMGL